MEGSSESASQGQREGLIRTSRSQHRATMLKVALISVVCGVVFFTVGILIGHFAIDKKQSVPRWVDDVKKDVDERFINTFLSEVDNIRIQENLR